MAAPDEAQTRCLREASNEAWRLRAPASFGLLPKVPCRAPACASDEPAYGQAARVQPFGSNLSDAEFMQ
jgi:hypothetical protein